MEKYDLLFITIGAAAVMFAIVKLIMLYNGIGA